MSIYIHGAKFPEKDGLIVLRIWGNGVVERYEGWNNHYLFGVKATDIPVHGRLIDADELLLYNVKFDDHDEQVVYAKEIEEAKTIIPADEEYL